jgi:hypothetical protein
MNSVMNHVIKKLDALPSVLGTVCESRNEPWMLRPYIACRTYLDKRQLDQDRINGMVVGSTLHEAANLLESAGFSPRLSAGAQCWLDWELPIK